ncbi:hypothetical protein [Pollutibacter soli]|uniref:hypothetical protein n=1 Tax=Pollutibacter soli TaxID=3034157 RepID=UPI0030135C50
MKRIVILLQLICLSYAGFAQVDDQAEGNDSKKIQAMEVAYITKELNLSPEEAEKFWPIFNRYRSEVKAIVADKSIPDPLSRQQKILNLRIKYRDQFIPILNASRSNKVFPAVDQFRQLVRRELLKRQNERQQINQGKRGG